MNAAPVVFFALTLVAGCAAPPPTVSPDEHVRQLAARVKALEDSMAAMEKQQRIIRDSLREAK